MMVSIASQFIFCFQFRHDYTLTDMYIGFPKRFSFVRENMSANGTTFSTFLALHSLRESENEYPLVISVTDGTATVTDAPTSNLTWDVAFGTRDVASNTLVSSHSLRPGETEITMIRLVIMNDFNSEDNETFTLRVSLDDGGVVRRNFDCYDDGEDPVEGNYFCSHTITIIDDEGQF